MGGTMPTPIPQSTVDVPPGQLEGLLTGQQSLCETGIWSDKHALWRRYLQVADGRYLSIAEDYSRSDNDGGWILWPGSLVLARCVEAAVARGCLGGGDGSVAPVAVELGAGSGLVSLVAAAAGMAVLATEQDSVLEFLNTNVGANRELLLASGVGRGVSGAPVGAGTCRVQRLCADPLCPLLIITELNAAAVSSPKAALGHSMGHTRRE